MIDRVDGRSLRTGFLRSTAMRPDAACFVIKDQPTSYAEADQAARCWASAIVSRLGRPARRVGVFASRSRESYIGVLAALFSGGTFVPLNPKFPPGRTLEIIRQAELDAIILDRQGLEQFRSIHGELTEVPLLLLPEIDPVEGLDDGALFAPELSAAAPLQELPPLLPGDIAYLMFTSGSTGVPKGVPVTHANALSFIDFASAHYGISAEDRFSQTFDQTFDLSIFDLFVAWEHGACVYSLQPIDLIAPARFIARNAITVWFSVPSIPALMRKKNTLLSGSLPSLRLSLFCGEPLPAATAAAWQAAAPNSIVENLYGPTELTIACLWYRWSDESSPDECVNGIVPIGHPFDGLGAVLLDEAMQPADAGSDGELCVCGPQTTPGYWRDPVKTSERFFTLESEGFPSERFYRTGDRVRRLPSGNYAYLGRTDQQVKVMGYRVELGDIEACLRGTEGVIDAVAVAWPIVDGTAEGIVAWVTGPAADPEQARAEASARLPDYMVPKAIYAIESMPLNANGKIDRKALVAQLEPMPTEAPAS